MYWYIINNCFLIALSLKSWPNLTLYVRITVSIPTIFIHFNLIKISNQSYTYIPTGYSTSIVYKKCTKTSEVIGNTKIVSVEFLLILNMHFNALQQCIFIMLFKTLYEVGTLHKECIIVMRHTISPLSW